LVPGNLGKGGKNNPPILSDKLILIPPMGKANSGNRWDGSRRIIFEWSTSRLMSRDL
jgi:hypothetical protein